MNNEDIINLFKRYKWGVDEQLTPELENIYKSSTENERIQITKISNERSNDAYMPDEWVELTLKHGSRNEKIALARFSDSPTVRCKKLDEIEDYSDKSNKGLDDLLLESEDDLIKCALYENPSFFGESNILWESGQADIFRKASPIERLAIIRNPNIGFEVINGICDIKNPFNLSDKERRGLIVAFRQNEGHIQRSRAFDEPYMERYIEKYDMLWGLAFEWFGKAKDSESDYVPYVIFSTFGCRPEKMLEVYRKLRDVSSLNDEQIKSRLNSRKAIFDLIQSLKLEKPKLKKFLPLLKEGLADSDGKDRDEMFSYSICGIASSLLRSAGEESEVAVKSTSIALKVIGYIWQVLINLITLSVMFIIFSYSGSKFESMALTILVLIYLIIVSNFAYSSRIQGELWHESYARHKRLRELLNEKQSPDEEENEKESYNAIKNSWEKNTVKFWINSIFLSIFYFIALANLIRVVLLSY